MWTVAGVLLGFVVLTTLLGFHVGPHSHFVASVLGVLTAVWFVVMLATGHDEPLLFALLSADAIVTVGVGTAAYKGIQSLRHDEQLPPRAGLLGRTGTALTDLAPEGVVRVGGENWSADALRGPIAKGTIVEVVEKHGVRLGVWEVGTDGAPVAPAELFRLDPPGHAALDEHPSNEQRSQPT